MICWRNYAIQLGASSIRKMDREADIRVGTEGGSMWESERSERIELDVRVAHHSSSDESPLTGQCQSAAFLIPNTSWSYSQLRGAPGVGDGRVHVVSGCAGTAPGANPLRCCVKALLPPRRPLQTMCHPAGSTSPSLDVFVSVRPMHGNIPPSWSRD